MSKVIQWVLILVLQVVVLNNLELSRFIIPQVFVFLLISLPLHLSRNAQIIIAFVVGLTVDLFTSTPGIHASGCLSLVLIRMMLLSRLDLKEHAANKMSFSIITAGFAPFWYVTTLLVVFYHFYVFVLSSIGAIPWYELSLTTLFSSVLSLLIIGLIQFIALRD